jgi:hypothetical protein
VGVFVGVFLGLSEKKKEVKSRGTKASSSPASRVQGKKKTHSAIQNDTVWGFSLLFFFETASFYPKHVVSFKRKWRQKRVKIQINP